MPVPLEEVRLDKWLWSVRLYKTRADATEACRAGNVKIAGSPVKPGRNLRVGEMLSARAGGLLRVVKVVGLTDKRVGAKLVPNYLEDHTPEEEYERAREQRQQSIYSEATTKARPTKKDRRALDRMKYFE